MATCTLTLDIGYGPDVVATGYVAIQRINRGDNGTMMVEAASTHVQLGSPFTTVTLEQGITYRFDEKLSGGGGKVVLATIPASATANYSDLTDLDPAAVIVPPNALLSSGTGSPEGVLTGTVGQLYTDNAVTNGAAVWRKNTGTGNTGWVVTSGDTGLRNIGSLLTSPYVSAANSSFIRRVNQTVEMRVLTTNADVISTAVYTLPTGFRPASPTVSYLPGLASSGGSTVAVQIQTTGDIKPNSTTSNLRWYLTWVTSDAWPTSLPGTAFP